MNTTELAGWSAAVLTLLAFTMRDVRQLRMASVAASVCFIAYGAATSAWPVLALHAVLLPVNLFRLHELRRPGRGAIGPLGKGAYWLLAPMFVLVLLTQGSTPAAAAEPTCAERLQRLEGEALRLKPYRVARFTCDHGALHVELGFGPAGPTGPLPGSPLGDAARVLQAGPPAY
jgi:hypothetical protein